MTTYKMTTINNGTRIRSDHNVYAGVLTSVNANVTVTGSELWEAPADGQEVKKGDKWVKVTHGGFTGWMAYVHKGISICRDLVIVPDAPAEVKFPTSFTLINNDDGSKAVYEFVKVL